MLALTVMLSMKLIGFLMLSVRHEAISQILGLLVLENGVFLGAQILVPGMPLLIEIVILFDLLIVVACFGVLVRYLLDPCRNDEFARTQAAGGLMTAIGHWRCAMALAPAAGDRPHRADRSPARRRGDEPRRERRLASRRSSHPGARDRAATFWGGYVIVDGLGAWTILCAAIVYFLASIYAVGYMRLLGETARLPRFYAMFAGFGLTTLIGPMMNNAGLYWIAIELTTLVSTFLVAFEREASSIEAAWKYIIVVSAGISLALLGTILFYWSGTFVLGPTYDMTWDALREAAPRLNPALVTLSFLLVLIGFGTKAGLAPMHTWLPGRP